MALYLGRVGALVQLPSPKTGMARPWVRRSSVQATIGGGQVVSFAPGGRRTYQPRWEVLSVAQYAVLEEFYTGMLGPGPWVLLDTQRRNMLAPNQASATSADGDADGFSVADGSGEVVTSNPDVYQRGPRSLRWTLPGTVVAGVLEVDPPAGMAGVPTPAGATWTFSGSLSCTGLAPSVSVTPTLSWRRSDGSEASTTGGTPVAAAVGAWSAFAVTGTVPAGCVALRAQLRVAPGVLYTAALTPGSVGLAVPRAPQRAGPAVAGGRASPVVIGPASRRPPPATVVLTRAPIASTDVLVDVPQLDLSSTVRAWMPGTGVPRVSIPDLSDSPIWAGQVGPVEATFIEVA